MILAERRPGPSRSTLAGAPFAIPRRFQRGAYVVEAGCAAEVVHLIRHGQARIFLLDVDGRETSTAIVGPGQLVGLAPLRGRAVHRKFAEALTPLDTWALPAAPLREELARDPGLLGIALGSLAQRVAIVLGLLRSVSLLAVPERVLDIERRLRLCLGGYAPALNRTRLAGLVHARPETLARTLPGDIGAAASHTSTNASRATTSSRLHFCTGDMVVPSDLPNGWLGIVRRGCVQLSLATGGRSIVVDTLVAGDPFGINDWLGLPPVGLHIRAVTDGVADVLRPGELLNYLATDPTVGLAMIEALAAHLERLEERLTRAAMGDASQRLLELLRNVAQREPTADPAGEWVVPDVWSHVALARQLGVCRETVTRALAALAGAGAIQRQGRRIVLVAPARADETQPPIASPDRRLSVHESDGIPPQQPVPPSQRECRVDRGAKARPARSPQRTAGATGAKRQPRLGLAGHCKLCGLAIHDGGLICRGCAERLELELELDAMLACDRCGRHRELCALRPCVADAAPPERASITWLRTDRIDEPEADHNSRRSYSPSSIAQLAVSIREHGVLQPLCVRPEGGRFRLVFGVRRLRAAKAAGLHEVPCIVQRVDDEDALLLNALENLHRQQLSGTERVHAIERLAASGLGVREISRRTGFNASTISRWLRIDGSPELRASLETGVLDVARARILLEAPRPYLSELIACAPRLTCAELSARVALLKRCPTPSGPRAADIGQLRSVLETLRGLPPIDDGALLDEIRHELDRIARPSERSSVVVGTAAEGVGLLC